MAFLGKSQPKFTPSSSSSSAETRGLMVAYMKGMRRGQPSHRDGGGESFGNNYNSKRKWNRSRTSHRSSRKENSYSPVGYQLGDIKNLKTMFEANADDSGTLSYDSFIDSRYLRYWPGKTSDAQSIWNEILGSCEQVCTFEEILKIQEVLDQIAREVESEMERERVLWSIEEVNYENMVSFYETAIDEQKRQGRKSKDKMRRMAEEEDISQQEQLTLQEQQLDELLSMVNEASSNGQVLNSITTTKITIHRHGIMEDVVNNAITRSESDNNQVDIHVRTSGAQYEDNESVSTRTTGSTSTSVSGASTYSNPVSKELMNDLLSCRSGDSISDSITSKRGSSQASRQSKNKSNVDIRPSQQSHIQCDDDDDDENDEEISSNLLSFQKFLQWDFIKAELWFHDNQGLTQKRLEEIWCRYTGSLQAGLTFNQFGDLYNEVVEFKYQA